MELDVLRDDFISRKEVGVVHKSIEEYLRLFIEMANLEQIDFYRYNFVYNDYVKDTDYGIDNLYSSKNILNEESPDNSKKYHIILKAHNIIFGKIVFNNRIKSTKAIKILLFYLKNKLYQEYTISKKFVNSETGLNIFIYSKSNTKIFAKTLQNDVNALFNSDVIMTNNLPSIVEKIEDKVNKNIIICVVNDYESIQNDRDLLTSFNDFIIVYGPNNHRLSLLCGQLKIEHYIAYEEYNKEYLRKIILDTQNIILNKFNSINSVLSIAGISGGIGCTTIAMNMANILANSMPNKNVLFIDLAQTKAISNLFLEHNPLPEKTIIDLVNTKDFDLENNLRNGLVKVKDNFYYINGIQKHTDREYLEEETFIENFLTYLQMINHNFNNIIIDTGVFEASNLKTAIYDISNEIELIIQLDLPDISKLKTLYSLIKRAGFKEKTSFLVNKFDEESSLNLNDIISILNTTEEDKIMFSHKIPNDPMLLEKYWDQCELISNIDKNSPFVRELIDFLIDKKILKVLDKKEEKKGFFSFFRRYL